MSDRIQPHVHQNAREWTITVCPECGAMESAPPTDCRYCERGGQLVDVIVIPKEHA